MTSMSQFSHLQSTAKVSINHSRVGSGKGDEIDNSNNNLVLHSQSHSAIIRPFGGDNGVNDNYYPQGKLILP